MHSKTRRRTAVAALAVAIGGLLLAIAASPAGASFAGPNGKIAFQSNRAGTYDLFVANADGSGLQNLTATSSADEFEPAWSADGRRLAFRRDGAIWVMNADGRGQRQVTAGSVAGELDREPAWSPDSSQIAFARSDTSGNWGIWAVPEGGGAARQLTSQPNDTGRDQSPAWSPDGSTIAFARSARGFASQLALVPANGTGSVQIVDTQITSSNAHPAWSPDGTKIAIDVNGGEAIAIFRPDGTRLSLGFVLFGQDPQWSPDGWTIVYNTRSGNHEIEWATLDGTTSGNVSGGDPADDRSPTWQPAPSAPAPNTPTGSNVFVAPVDPTTGQTPATITFANVALAGDTSVVSSSSGPPATGFQILGAYYEISTTATWDQSPPPAGGAEACFKYSGAPAPSILHFVAGQQQPVLEPTTRDTGQEVCAVVTSFSPFALARPAGDTAPPTISCDAADGFWHGGNVSIACTASDSGSGLADPADAAFTLSTNLPAGAEDPNAETGSHQVCDLAGNCATAGPIGGIKIDPKPPTLNMPANVTVEATSHAGATVTFSATATDGGSGVASVTCPSSGSTFPLGTTFVACTAADNVGNSSTGTFTVTVRDTNPPKLSIPSSVTVNATSPAGATVNYAASATDVAHPNPLVSCSPASGSTFAIGQATVNCTATDASNNSSNGSFSVKVKGAKEQLADLIQKVVDASQLSPAAKTLLIGKLNQLLASFDPGNATQKQAVCLALQVFKAAVQLQAGKTITQAQAAEWIADANRIRAVLGC